MKFENDIPIYLQIENYIKDKIFSKIWLDNERIPSVRELAEILEVNPNTIMKAYEKLQSAEIIFMQRGIGYFVNETAYSKIFSQKKEFFLNDLELLFKQMDNFSFSIDQVNAEYNKFSSQK